MAIPTIGHPVGPGPGCRNGLRNVAGCAKSGWALRRRHEAATAEIVTGIARLSEAVAGEAISARSPRSVPVATKADRPDGF